MISRPFHRHPHVLEPRLSSADSPTAQCEGRKQQQRLSHPVLTGALLSPASLGSHRPHAIPGRSRSAPRGVEEETGELACLRWNTSSYLQRAQSLNAKICCTLLFPLCFLGPKWLQFENHDEFNIDQAKPQKQFFPSWKE